MSVRRSGLPSGRFPDRVLVHAVRVHADDHYRRALVHNHVRHTPEPAAQAGRFRQHNGRWMAVLGGDGRTAADGDQRLLQDQVSRHRGPYGPERSHSTVQTSTFCSK